MAVVANVGTTSVGAIDPIEDIAEICAAHDTWLHVDAAYGGFWRLAPQVGPQLPDLSRADSLVANPHKVLMCPMEASALFCGTAMPSPTPSVSYRNTCAPVTRTAASTS